MKKNIIIWGLALILVCVAFYVTRSHNNNTSKPAVPNQINSDTNQSDNAAGPASGFTLVDLNGNKVSLSDFKGKKNIFLNFWTTWCPSCREEMPEIEKIYQQYKDKDLVVLTVDIAEDKATVKSFIEKNNYHFNVLLDSGQDVSDIYRITSIPTSFFIDKDGNIRAKHVGGMTEEQMKGYLKLLGVE